MASQLVPSLYERIGNEAGFQRLSQLFYDSIYDGIGARGGGNDSDRQNNNNDDDTDDDDAWFRGIFASSTKVEAIDNQYRFLVQTFGGPNLYQQKKGHARLVGRHAAYPIGSAAAVRWLFHMHRAVTQHENLRDDMDARNALLEYVPCLCGGAGAVGCHGKWAILCGKRRNGNTTAFALSKSHSHLKPCPLFSSWHSCFRLITATSPTPLITLW